MSIEHPEENFPKPTGEKMRTARVEQEYRSVVKKRIEREIAEGGSLADIIDIHDEATFQGTPRTDDEKFEVAVNHLYGNTPDFAEILRNIRRSVVSEIQASGEYGSDFHTISSTERRQKAEKEDERRSSDEELVEGGATYVKDSAGNERLELTPAQMEAKAMVEKTRQELYEILRRPSADQTSGEGETLE